MKQLGYPVPSPSLPRRHRGGNMLRASLGALLALALASCYSYTWQVRPAAPEKPRISISSQDIHASTDTALAAMLPRLDEIFSDPRFAHAEWGVLVESLKTGDVWYSRNADRLFIPASNEKIPTTAAALSILGPQFTFETSLRHTGKIEGGALRGDLVIAGDGDPTLCNRFLKDSRDVFREWARLLREKGVQRIEGDIIGDDDAFEEEHLGSGWPHDQLADWPFAEYGALQINENVIDIEVVPPADASSSASLRPNLPSAYYTLVNHIRVSSDAGNSALPERPYGSNVITLTGAVRPKGKPFEVSPTITNPTLFYVTVLKETLEAEGIKVAGRARDIDDISGRAWKTADLPRLAVHRSPPLREIIKGLMKRSQNLYAETMVRAIGRARSGSGTFEAGRKALREQLQSFGVEPRTYSYSDGSGLSRYNFISPRQIATILKAMRKHEYADAWVDSMPIAGVDGTLRSRMKETPAAKNVRAKTGTVSNVRALSGYLTTADGEELVFSMLVNAHLRSNRETEEVTDSACALLAGLDRRPKPAANEPAPAK